MTAKKRLTSIICIVSLILAITVGIMLSVGAQPNHNNGGESVSLSNTDVTVIANSSTKENSSTEGERITTVAELQAFLKDNDKQKGYLDNDLEGTFDWSVVGSEVVFNAGRVLDGNGHTVNIADTNGGANSGVDGRDPLADTWDHAMKRNYGALVAYNYGTIRNIKFVYNSTSGEIYENDGDNRGNYVGLVCGTNVGTIENCDLTVSGAFTYRYNKTSVNIFGIGAPADRNQRFETYWGGIAGRNAGVIKNITAQYSNFTLTLETKAQNKSTASVEAKSIAGGIAGTNVAYNDIKNTEISNIIVLGKATFTLTSTGAGSAKVYREFATVVSGNSEYSHGAGKTEDAQAKVDNIIVDFEITATNKSTIGDYLSRNNVVSCGRNSNVTLLTVDESHIYNNQHLDYQTDHCECGMTSEYSQHKAGFGNLIHVDPHSNVTVAFDEDNNQVITVEAKDKQNAMLGEFVFTKFEGRGSGGTESGLDDTATYADVANNATTYFYNQEDVRLGKYEFKIRPYQATPDKFWEIWTYSYEIATIHNVGDKEYTYTGKDYLTEQLGFTTLTNSKSGTVNPEGFNAKTADEYEYDVNYGRLPGTYTFTLKEKEAGLAYIDTVNKVVAYTEENPTEYSFTVNLTEVVPLDASLLADNWLSERQDFKFAIVNPYNKVEKDKDGNDVVVQYAVDGYVYEVNGSSPTPSRTGLFMYNNVDTTSAGRTYKIQLTSGGAIVTKEYTYTVKIDMTAPTAKITRVEHPANEYYAHNTIEISATDRASGVETIKMFSDGVEKETIKGKDDPDVGTYTLKFSHTGNNVIKVTDFAGNESEIEVDVLIDNFKPTIDVKAYYYGEGKTGNTGADGNPEIGLVKKDYEYNKDKPVESAVYFDATATFGESGGEIRYTLDGWKHWEVLATQSGEGTVKGTLMVKKNAEVEFNAVANTKDHPATDVDPYPNTKRVNTLWEETVIVNIKLKDVEISLNDIVFISDTKVFDGTDNFDINNVKVRDGFESDNEIDGVVKINSVKYATSDAGDGIALTFDVTCTDDTKVIVNKIEGAVGSITKKGISVKVDSKTKYYGYEVPELTYTADMIAGKEEPIKLYVQGANAENGYGRLLPQTQHDDSIDGYVITVVEDQIFTNYEIVDGGVTTGLLHINLAPIDRFIYEKGAYTGLDTNNIADRDLSIEFMRANGNKEALTVKFYGRVLEYDANTGNYVDKGYSKEYTLKTIKNAPAGFYKVVITLPTLDANEQLLTDKYFISDDLYLTDTVNKDKNTKYNFMIKIIDASIFDKVKTDEEEPAKQDADKNINQQTPVVNNSNAQVGTYEDGNANADSTDMVIEPAKKSKDYIAMISIFCAVAMAIAFALGVGRVICKRARK